MTETTKTTTRWRLIKADLDERDPYTATFVMLNVDTDTQVTVALTTQRGGPASDLVGSLRATTFALLSAAGAPDSDAQVEKLN